MRIETKEQLRFCIAADRIMNGRDVDGNPVVNLLRRIAKPDPIMSYLKSMRKIQFFRGKNEVARKFCQWRYNALGLKLGFSIDPMVFSEGLVIPHYGTIVVGGGQLHWPLCSPAHLDLHYGGGEAHWKGVLPLHGLNRHQGRLHC